MIVFDVTRISTFEAVAKWKADIDAKVDFPSLFIFFYHLLFPFHLPFSLPFFAFFHYCNNCVSGDLRTRRQAHPSGVVGQQV